MHTQESDRLLHLTLSELRELIRREVEAALNRKHIPVEDDEVFSLPLIDVGEWNDTLSLRREDMYGDDGR
jgi:predicted component of type VI protein secretion system